MRVACLYFSSQTNLIQVAEIFLKLSPQICIGKSAIFIEVGKCHRLYSEKKFVAYAQVLLRKLELQASISIESDISSAFVFAKFYCSSMDKLPLQALVDIADPFEKDETIRKSISKMIETLVQVGHKSIAEFKTIPVTELTSRFGAVSILCVQKLRGDMLTPWIYWKPAEVISEKYEFAHYDCYGQLEQIIFKLKEQLDSIFQRLWARNLRVQRLQVKIFCETNSIHPEPFRKFEFDFITPQGATKGTLNVVKERLYKDFEKKPIATPVEAVETTVLQTVVGTSGQKNIFHNNEEKAANFHAIIAQLVEAHGKDNIYHAELTEDRRPEKSWRKVQNYLTFEKGNSVSIEGKIPLRPTHLIRPLKVEVTAGYIHIKNRKFKILSVSAEVERITGGWAERTTDPSFYYQRNYYEFTLDGAPKVSVFETSNKEFFLHGFFG